MRRKLFIWATIVGLACLGIGIYAITHINTKAIVTETQSIKTSSGIKLSVTAITFHEGFRSPGQKAADVELTLIGVTDEHYIDG